MQKKFLLLLMFLNTVFWLAMASQVSEIEWDFWLWDTLFQWLCILALIGGPIILVFIHLMHEGWKDLDGTDENSQIQYKDLPRKPFPEWIKQSTMQNQDGKCNMCGIPLNNYIAQYDHVDNDKTNNQPSNCQALCANCHSEKTKMNR
tara:strand:- start:47 stop:487 length:441 start_codon:yes stop_codon:yes gene_type:complete